MELIKNLLDSLDKLSPIETDTKANYHMDPEIKVVIFDIYGTLLISSSGDIDQAEISEDNLAKAFKAADIEVIDKSGNALRHILHDFEYTIQVCHSSAKKANIPYPEIDILSIWEIVLIHARRKKLIAFNNDVNVMRMTCFFEFLSNRVYPMPGLKETVEELKRRKVPIGIVSNAQFYTPVLMNYYLNDVFKLDERIDRFDSELLVYSYKFGVGKPDKQLFEELVPALKRKFKLEPSQALFVGNDMLKDIYASQKVGFKTALFAGDKRSLRWRKDDERTKDLMPNHVITELKQVLEIVKP